MTVTLPALPLRRTETTSLSEAEFDLIFSTYWEKIYRLLARLLSDPADAEDVAVEVFLRLNRQPPTWTEPSQIGGWLYRVATNLGWNALRAAKRRSGYEAEAGKVAFDHPSLVSPAHAVEAADEYELVRRVLGEMKPRSAQLLWLRHSGLSYAEIAAALELAPNSVGTLLARATSEFEARYRAASGE